MNKLAIIREFWKFLCVQKKWWLAPIVVFLLVLGACLFLQKAQPWHLSSIASSNGVAAATLTGSVKPDSCESTVILQIAIDHTLACS